MTKTKPQPADPPPSYGKSVAAANGLPGRTGLAGRLTTAGRQLPSRVILHATEKWGKTSFAAYAPAPVFLLSRGEDGLETLIDHSILPPTPHFAPCESLADARVAVNSLIVEEHDRKTLVLDVANGFTRLAEEETCRAKFNGDWADYDAYGRGPKVTVALWSAFLDDLDRLRAKKQMAIVLLTHTVVKNFRNPEGADYDRYQPDMPAPLWGVTHRWADAILFGGYITAAEKERGQSKAKARGGEHRMIYTSRTAAYDAGNRYSLPEALDCAGGPEAAFQSFLSAVKAARKQAAAA